MSSEIKYWEYEAVTKVIGGHEEVVPVDIAEFYGDSIAPPFKKGEPRLHHDFEGKKRLKQYCIQLPNCPATILITSRYNEQGKIQRGLVGILAENDIHNDLIEQIGKILPEKIKFRKISK